MDFDFETINNNLQPKKGRLLLSGPLSEDAFFSRSVILLTEHNENGSVGFALNKTTKIFLNELFEKVEIKIPVFLGGPVKNNTLHFIHNLGEIIDGSINIIDKIYWGGDFNQVTNLINKKIITLNNSMFFVGYSGWNKNQLNEEILKNYWLVTETNQEIIFEKPNKNLWENIVKTFSGKYKIWQNVPINPNFN